MTDQIREQLTLFVMAIYTGAVMAFVYDFIRIIRRIKKVSELWIWLQDIIYWDVFVYVAYALLLKYNYGGIRWYAFGGIITGMLLYYATVSRAFVQYASVIIVKFISIATKTLKFVFKPIKLGLSLISKYIDKVIKWYRKREEKRIREKVAQQQEESAGEADRKEEVTIDS